MITEVRTRKGRRSPDQKAKRRSIVEYVSIRVCLLTQKLIIYLSKSIIQHYARWGRQPHGLHQVLLSCPPPHPRTCTHFNLESNERQLRREVLRIGFPLPCIEVACTSLSSTPVLHLGRTSRSPASRSPGTEKATDGERQADGDRQTCCRWCAFGVDVVGVCVYIYGSFPYYKDPK